MQYLPASVPLTLQGKHLAQTHSKVPVTEVKFLHKLVIVEKFDWVFNKMQLLIEREEEDGIAKYNGSEKGRGLNNGLQSERKTNRQEPDIEEEREMTELNIQHLSNDTQTIALFPKVSQNTWVWKWGLKISVVNEAKSKIAMLTYRVSKFSFTNPIFAVTMH